MDTFNESNLTSYYPDTTEGLTTEEGDGASLKYNDSELYVGFGICVLGLLFNMITSAIICFCCRRKNKMKTHTCFLLNIIISDILIAVFGVLFFGLKIYQNNFVLRDLELTDSDEKFKLRMKLQFTVDVIKRVWVTGTTGNILGLFLMSLDHFIAVKWSLKHHILLRKRVIAILITCAWLLAVLNGILYDVITYKGVREAGAVIVRDYFVNETEYDEFYEQWNVYRFYHDGKYFIDLKQKYFIHITAGVDLAVVSLVFLTLLLIYGYIAWVVLKAARERHHSLRYSISSTAKERFNQMRNQKAKGLCTTIALLVSFLLLWMPLQVYYILTLVESPAIPLNVEDQGKIERILMVVCSCTTLVDILIYFMRSRETLMRLRTFRQKFCMSTVADGRNVTVDNVSYSNAQPTQRQAIQSTATNLQSG